MPIKTKGNKVLLHFSVYKILEEIDKNMHYILSNQSETAFVYYNCHSQISITTEIEKAHHFKSATAYKVLNNKTKMMLQFGKMWKLIPCTAEQNEELQLQIDIDNIQCLQNEVEAVQKIIEQIQILKKMQSAVSEKESEFDRKLIDKYHEIEFSQCSASDGYKQYKQLRELLLERRAIKNTSKIISIFMKSSVSEVSTIATINMINQLAHPTSTKRIT